MMSFDLSNTSVSFLSYINKFLAKKLDVFVPVYLDDILIYTNNVGPSYNKTVQLVLEKLRKYLSYTNPKKYQFH